MRGARGPTRVQLGPNSGKGGWPFGRFKRAEESMSLKLMSLVALALVTTVAVLPSARAETPPFVFPDFCCYYNGSVVRTVTPPAFFPNEGWDNLYVVKSQPIIGVTRVARGSVRCQRVPGQFYGGTVNYIALR